MDTNCVIHWIKIYPLNSVNQFLKELGPASHSLSSRRVLNQEALLLGISPENIRNQSFIISPQSFVSRKSTKKLTSEEDCLRCTSWSAGQFHIQNLLSTEKKMTERVPHLTWTFYMKSTAPLYSAILQHKTRKKKHCNIRKWALMTEWLCLKLYKSTRERLRTDIFFSFFYI